MVICVHSMMCDGGVAFASGFGQFHNESEVGYWTGLLGECRYYGLCSLSFSLVGVLRMSVR